jgi:hypothetical protein
LSLSSYDSADLSSPGSAAWSSSAGKSDPCCGRLLNAVGRPGLHQSGLTSTCFTDCPFPGPRRNGLTIHWALGPFVRHFILLVDPGDICTPQPRLLDCGTSAATRGDLAHDPTVPTEHIDHGSVSHGRRRDGQYGQKWADSNGGSRRTKAVVKSSASSRPLLGKRESPLPRHEDDAPVFHSSNGSRTHKGCPANHSSRRINSTAGQATPLAGEAGDASPPP